LTAHWESFVPQYILRGAQITWKRLLPSLVLCLLVACGSDDANPIAGIKVYKHRGSIQCGDPGTPPEVMRRELTDAGITVLSFGCGHDGLGRVAVCGSPDGAIHIFEILHSQVEAALSLSFVLMSSSTTAVESPCP
jgi:hypothetical protein